MPTKKAAGLNAGDPAPEFEIETDAGTRLRLSDVKGKNVVLYFYPKADTPGCTREACDFRDNLAGLAGKDAVVLGISPDKPSRQASFKRKYELPFTLLSDVDNKVAAAYGVWKEKSMYGKTYMGIERTTFVIGKDGKIARIFPKVKVDGHVQEVLAAL
ncbi:MAG: thioredoxin-dependent thiol peroxidase [Bryobacteraceae bacterium]|nr:thioredoxin-dependent thiol peroxidase [Bryobacteraceae bacterium]